MEIYLTEEETVKSIIGAEGWKRGDRYKVAAVLPVTRPSLTLHACMYLISGDTSSGKSTAGRLVASVCAMAGIRFVYLEIDEPGAPRMSPAEQTLIDWKTMVKQASSGTATVPERMPRDVVNRAAFTTYFKRIREEVKETDAKVCVIDSIWCFIAMAATILDVPSPKGGIHPAYAMAARSLDRLAMELGCAIVGVQNTELFPIPKLSGATGGVIAPTLGPSLTVEDRNHRKPRRYAVPRAAWNAIIKMRSV